MLGPVADEAAPPTVADQARAELMAAHTYSRWVSRAPGPDEKLYLAEIAREETEHWYKAIALLGELGVSPEMLSGDCGRA